MILLELTEKEMDFIKEVIELEKTAVSKSDVGYAEKERKTGICNSFLAKVELTEKKQEDVLITAKDLFGIISAAKDSYTKIPSCTQISNKEIEQNYYVHIALANSLIMWLNGKNLLKRLAKFDYTDQSGQYDVTED